MVDGGEQDGGIHVHVISLKAFGDVHADAVAQFVLGGVERESSGSLPRRSLPGLGGPGSLGGRLRTGFSRGILDRKSTRLNSSHGYISYAVFCLKKKKK